MSVRLWFIAALVLSVMTLAACGDSADSTPQPAAAPATAVATAVPAAAPTAAQPESPLAAPVSPLSAPESPLAAPPAAGVLSGCDLDFPAPADGTGVVCGVVISNTPVTRYFLAGDFYLAPVIYSKATLEDGSEIDVPFVSLNVGSDKRADVKTETGAFVFQDVPPGEYGVVIYTPLQSFLFHTSEGTETLLIQVEPGEIERLEPIALD